MWSRNTRVEMGMRRHDNTNRSNTSTKGATFFVFSSFGFWLGLGRQPRSRTFSRRDGRVCCRPKSFWFETKRVNSDRKSVCDQQPQG